MKIQAYIKYLIYRFKWYTAKYINYSSPVHIDIELSTRCNLNCEFCFRREFKYPAKDMDYKMLQMIAGQMNELNVQSVKPNWRGEALMNPEWMMLGYFFKESSMYPEIPFKGSSMYPKIPSLEINTSLAMNLNDKQLEYLAKDFDSIDISIDSSIPNIYNKIRKGADFHKTYDNLKRLIKLRKQYNMPKIILNRRTSKLTESDEQFKEFFGKDVNYDIRPAIDRNQKQIYFEGLRKRERKYCGQPSRRMVIDVDGNVWSCCVAYTQDEKLLLGNIKDKTLKECWNSLRRALLVQSLKRNIFKCETCKNCSSGEAYK